jgi:hypothetical protein
MIQVYPKLVWLLWSTYRYQSKLRISPLATLVAYLLTCFFGISFRHFRTSTPFSSQVQEGDKSTSFQTKAGDPRSISQIKTGVAFSISQTNAPSISQAKAGNITPIVQNKSGDSAHTSQAKTIDASSSFAPFKAINTTYTQVNTRLALAKRLAWGH